MIYLYGEQLLGKGALSLSISYYDKKQTDHENSKRADDPHGILSATTRR
jgi:hypothetical protein